MIDHEGEDIVLVDAHDDDGAVHSLRNRTPVAAGTTEAADAKKLERLLYQRVAFGRGPPKSGPPSASGAAKMVRWRFLNHGPNGGRESLEKKTGFKLSTA